MKKFLLMTLFAFGAVSVSFGDCVSNCEAVAKNNFTALTTCLAGCPKSTNASKKIDLLPPVNQSVNTHESTTMPTITPKPKTGSRTYIDSYSELRVGSESSVGDCVSSCEAVYGSDDMAMSRCIGDCYKDDSSKPISIESLQPSSLPDSDFDNELKVPKGGNIAPQMKLGNDDPDNKLKLLGGD